MAAEAIPLPYIQFFAATPPQGFVAFLPLGPISLKSLKPKAYKDPPETLGEHLCKKRTLRGALLKDTARQLGVSAWTCRNWEKDRTKPAVRFIPRVIEFLGYDPFPKPKTLGERIAGKRQRLGLSQEKLAKLLGVDEATVRHWKRGQWKPNLEIQRIVHDFLVAQREHLIDRSLEQDLRASAANVHES